MKIAPLNGNVAVLIHEDHEVVFTPAFKPKNEVIKQQEEDFTFRDTFRQYRLIGIYFKIKYFCCVFVFLIIIGVVIFVIACGHNMCPGTGMGGSSRRPPPQ
jgi:hypothetical protein